MDLSQNLQQATSQLAQAQQKFDKADNELRLMRSSREAFIKSLRYTGLSYAHAKSKYDNCHDEQDHIHHQALLNLQHAEQHRSSLILQAKDQAVAA